MRRNPLHPDAWLTEEHRFDMPGESADIRLGVHTAENSDTALAYAVHKASQEGDLPNGAPNCGIVFTLDMMGLEPLPEADAIVAAKDESAVISEMRHDPKISQEINTPNDLAEAMLDFIEGSREAEDFGQDAYPDNWFEAFWQEHVFPQGPWVILNPLERLAEADPQELFRVMREAFETNSFPLELWAEAIGQYRYMAEVGFDRLLRVEAVHPVEPELFDWEDETEGEGGPMTFGSDYVAAPPTKLLWDSGRTSKVTEYHGTDIVRARQAFPELEDVFQSPWPFGQPEGVGPA